MSDSQSAAQPISLYVHFPWCVSKCPYCDFNSHPLKGSLDEVGYRDALQADLQQSLAELDRSNDTARPIGSVFFGGGTPSLFKPESFAQLLQTLQERLLPSAEITLEANPGTLEHSDFAGYRQAGINRLSLGAQSFDDNMLRRLGRIHSSAETHAAFAKARQAGFERINLDLMYALPQQQVDQALEDLQQALALQPDHLSWYQLTLEPKTEFYLHPPRLPHERLVAEIEEQGRQMVSAAGLSRYEVSAFAQPDQASAHNLNYWTFGDYLGVGAGAHGKVYHDGQTVRTAKPRQPRLYLANPRSTSQRAVVNSELPAEFAMNALRLREGVNAACYSQRTGRSSSDLAATWERLAALGLMQSERFAATAKGYGLLDSLIAEFL